MQCSGARINLKIIPRVRARPRVAHQERRIKLHSNGIAVAAAMQIFMLPNHSLYTVRPR